LSTGTEVYSRLLRVTKDTGTDEFLDRFYPETIEHKDGTDLSFVLRRRESNAKNGDNRI
jgi:hypothetical protein